MSWGVRCRGHRRPQNLVVRTRGYGAPAHGVPGVAGTRLLKLKEVLEKELVERQLIERVAESGS
jgi:hypothetical protein